MLKWQVSWNVFQSLAEGCFFIAFVEADILWIKNKLQAQGAVT